MVGEGADKGESRLNDSSKERANENNLRKGSGKKWKDFSDWFDHLLLEARIVDDRYPVKGFTVYTGWGYSIVKRVYQMLEERLEEEGHQPMRFPVVIPEDSFQAPQVCLAIWM